MINDMIYARSVIPTELEKEIDALFDVYAVKRDMKVEKRIEDILILLQSKYPEEVYSPFIHLYNTLKCCYTALE